MEVVPDSTPPTGRKDSTGQPAVINLDPLRKKLDNLVALFDKAKIAADMRNEAIAKVAEQSGLMASVVKKLVAAKAKGTVLDKQREVEQLQIVFDDQNETAAAASATTH